MNKLDIGDFLKVKGIKPSYQRMKIYEYLLNNRTHPTVDIIYKALAPDIPTLSKTTVYNTLNLFIENGIVNIIVIEENQTRYDVDTSIHGHFKCDVCEKIYDLNLEPSFLQNLNLNEFQINEQHLYLKGICKTCKK
ncbi:MAG: Fur family transcriptional regulator [Fusobacteriaceae bacterium]